MWMKTWRDVIFALSLYSNKNYADSERVKKIAWLISLLKKPVGILVKEEKSTMLQEKKTLCYARHILPQTKENSPKCCIETGLTVRLRPTAPETAKCLLFFGDLTHSMADAIADRLRDQSHLNWLKLHWSEFIQSLFNRRPILVCRESGTKNSFS